MQHCEILCFVIFCYCGQILEYAPSTLPENLRLQTADEARVVLTEEQERALAKAHLLLGFHAASQGNLYSLNREDLVLAVRAITSERPTDALIDSILERFSSSKSLVSLDEFRSLVTSGMLHPQHVGRHWVAVSLAEAETIRRILHVRKKKNPEQIIPNAHVDMALRYSLMCSPGSPSAGDGGVVFDASWGWQRRGSGATPYEAAVAHRCGNCFNRSSCLVIKRSFMTVIMV